MCAGRLTPRAHSDVMTIERGGNMGRFGDKRTENVYRGDFPKSLPEHVARSAQWNMGLLDAPSGQRDHRASNGNRFEESQGEIWIPVSGKWYVALRWEDLVGATNIQIARNKA